MSDVPDLPKLVTPQALADQIVQAHQGSARIEAATAGEGLALNRAFMTIAHPELRAYLVALVEATAARASG